MISMISKAYIFPNKTNITGQNVNVMTVTCRYVCIDINIVGINSPQNGYRNVSIAVTCRYDFQDNICRIKIRFNLYIVKGT